MTGVSSSRMNCRSRQSMSNPGGIRVFATVTFRLMHLWWARRPLAHESSHCLWKPGSSAETI